MRSLPVRQGSLWEPRCYTCLAYDQCGGAETAPCGCIQEAERRRACSICPIICTERSVTDDAGQVIDSFRIRLREGRPLAALRIRQPSIDLPSLVLSRTDNFPESQTLPNTLVGVHLRTVLSLVRRDPEWQQPSVSLRSQLRVNPATRLIAVLNGEDDLLEDLWSVDPNQLFRRLRAAGVEVVTGPTYSVYREHPASHNVAMLLRHHQFCAEAVVSGFVVIPNLYWNSTTDRRAWVSWLRENPTVSYVARDFSRTKHRGSFQLELAGLLEIVKAAPQLKHVLITGVGEKKILETRRALVEAGASVSFVSPEALVAPPAFERRPLPPEAKAGAIRQRIERFQALTDGSELPLGATPYSEPRLGSARLLVSEVDTGGTQCPGLPRSRDVATGMAFGSGYRRPESAGAWLTA